MQLIIEENDLIFCYLIKYVIWILLFTVKIAFVIAIFFCILNQIIFYIFNCIHFLNHFYFIFNFLASACFNDKSSLPKTCDKWTTPIVLCTFLLQLMQKVSPLAWRDPMPTACHRGPLWRRNMLGPKEPNLYKDREQWQKESRSKFFPPKKFWIFFFFENLDLDPDVQSRSGFSWFSRFSKKNFKNFFF